jgi:hypothetical protein
MTLIWMDTCSAEAITATWLLGAHPRMVTWCRKRYHVSRQRHVLISMMRMYVIVWHATHSSIGDHQCTAVDILELPLL